MWQSQSRGHLKTCFQGVFSLSLFPSFNERGFLLGQPLFGDPANQGTILLKCITEHSMTQTLAFVQQGEPECGLEAGLKGTVKFAVISSLKGLVIG